MFGGRRRAAKHAQESERVPFSSVNWPRLFSFLKPHLWRMAIAIVTLLIASGINLAFPLLIIRLLDSVLTAGNLAQLNQLTLTLVIIFLIQAVVMFVQTYLLSSIGERIVLDMRTTLYRHLQHLSLSFFENHRVGELVSRISSDVTQIRSVLTNNITQLLTHTITLVGSVVIVFWLNPRLVGFVLGIAIVIIAVAIIFGIRLQNFSTKVQDELASATVTVEEGLQGIRVVKSFAREEYEIERYNNAMNRTLMVSLGLARFRSAFGSLIAFLGFASIAGLLWFSGREVLEGRSEFSTISGFIIYAITIASSLGQLSNVYGQVREALGAVQRVFELLDTKSAIVDEADAHDLDIRQGSISFEQVSFSYDGITPVLKEVSLDIKPGEVIALVGPSGAGKSTFFNLLPRFYDPSQGRVLIDGTDIRHVTQLSLRQQIGLVPQETLLFGGSIRENIAYGRLGASEADIIAAAKAANAHDFITTMPQGYDTLVGERGIKLSGGQRQRIAIARTILKDPKILLLDEATSALDSESEELVQDALNYLMQDRTSVIIAHRLSTIKIADRIAVLDSGQIIELGTHNELMELNGLYARLYTMQFRVEEPIEI